MYTEKDGLRREKYNGINKLLNEKNKDCRNHFG